MNKLSVLILSNVEETINGMLSISINKLRDIIRQYGTPITLYNGVVYCSNLGIAVHG
jgi:hypothetical protein